MYAKYIGNDGRLSINYFFMFLVESLVGVYLPVILLYRGFAASEIGELRALGYAMVVFGPYLYALFTEKIGDRRKSIQLGVILSGLTVVGLLLDLSYFFYALLIPIQFFFHQGTTAQLDALSLNTMKEKSKYGRVRIWGSIGFVATVVIGGWVNDNFGMDNLLWFMVAIQGIWLFIILLLPNDSLTKSKEVTSNIKSNKRFPITKSFIALIFVVFFIFVSQGVYSNFFFIHLNQLGYSDTTAGTMMSVGTVSEMLMLILSVNLLKNFKISYLLMASCLFTAIRWTIMAYGSDSIIFIGISQLGHAFTFGLLHVSVMYFIRNNFNNEHVGRATGIYFSVGLGCGMIVGSLMSGYTWEDFGPNFAYVSCALMAAMAMICSAFVRNNNYPKQVPAV